MRARQGIAELRSEAFEWGAAQQAAAAAALVVAQDELGQAQQMRREQEEGSDAQPAQQMADSVAAERASAAQLELFEQVLVGEQQRVN